MLITIPSVDHLGRSNGSASFDPKYVALIRPISTDGVVTHTSITLRIYASSAEKLGFFDEGRVDVIHTSLATDEVVKLIGETEETGASLGYNAQLKIIGKFSTAAASGLTT